MWLRSAYYVKESFRTLDYSRERISELQEKRFSQVYEVCKDLPFYTERWPETSQMSLKELDQLPVMEGEILRNIGEDVTGLLKERDKLSRYTSGTHKEPSRVNYSDQAYDWMSAVYFRTLCLHGYRPFQTLTQYRGRVEKRSWIGKRMMPENFIEPGTSISQQAELLDRYNPEVLRYFPHVLLAVAKKMEAKYNHSVSPERIFTCGELLTPSMRDYLEKVFDTEILDQYGTTEFGKIAWECPQGGYHLAEDTVYVEVVDHEGKEVGAGEVGQLVLTGLVNETTPLVRYAIGDLVETAESDCSCNTSFRRIKDIKGRKKDVFLNSNSELVYPTQVIDILAPLEELLFFQLVAEDDKYVLRYRSNEPGVSVSEEIAEMLRSKLALEPLETQRVKDIPFNSGGKLSLIKNNQSRCMEDAI